MRETEAFLPLSSSLLLLFYFLFQKINTVKFFLREKIKKPKTKKHLSYTKSQRQRGSKEGKVLLTLGCFLEAGLPLGRAGAV